MDGNILEMNNISKIFPGVVALDNVHFTVERGEVHALMGENGAGKSTLIKIMSGVYQKDSGQILFDGREINPKSVFESRQEGISTIYQELNMVPYLSVSENMFIGHYPTQKGVVQWHEMNLRAKELLLESGIDIDVRAELASQSTAIQQMIAITRAIHMESKLIIMDEPTSSLDTKETNVLFEIIRKLKQKGISVIFISHRLDEIFQISDRVTVLKDGKYVGTRDIKDINKYELVKMMVGREVEQNSQSANNRVFNENEVYQCELTHIKWRNKIADVSFTIRKGEILGLAGLLGAGRTESAKLLFGCSIPDGGSIFYEGERISLRTPNDAVRRKIAFCTENRRIEGIIPNMTVENNITLAYLPELSGKTGLLNKKKKNEIARNYIKELRIKCPSSQQAIKNLSGGNQQKVMLARWLCSNPKLIILDEPTRGIDVGAKAEIERLIVQFAEKGISVLLISSELQELIRNCDRVIVIRDGRSVAELSNEELCEETMMRIIAADSNAEEGTVCL